MRVKQIELTKITPYERNPRINAAAVDAVARSIQEFGFRQPIVVDAEFVIIAGHTRYLAAQKLGLKKVPVHVAEGLTAEQIKAYRIADNQTGNLAEWDTELLSIEVGELSAAEFDLDALGFPADELEKLIGVPAFGPAGIDEQSRLDEKAKVKCPECGHEF